MTLDTESVRRLTVAEGDDQDVCPHCGIWRENAGFLKETCGDGYMKPGCFIVRSDMTDLRSHEPPRNSGEGTAVNGPMPLGEKPDASQPDLS